jgi:hypothetical protein
MLGPALTEMLRRVADIPAAKRTAKQKAVLRELGQLYAAAKPDKKSTTPQKTGAGLSPQVHAELADMVRAPRFWDKRVLRITKPEPPSARICPICGADVS